MKAKSHLYEVTSEHFVTSVDNSLQQLNIQ